MVDGVNFTGRGEGRWVVWINWDCSNGGPPWRHNKDNPRPSLTPTRVEEGGWGQDVTSRGGIGEGGSREIRTTFSDYKT